ncbi:MAG: 30S ribosomal protein S8 [Candidatus Nealsonbacteria bacterium RBG_13_36_15]|uniref:Small ribosomal subunit protein uS8 n=1 Tax=Candidatus Nealsonbacteria bacterium RBG_13_36_15 TaxID=1801660 RepID=A0A1G2DWK0_9BACT|nr:MAG: 30S ribosomal protein S8 [Candidatus Nealsonbacteria bacterium RBG_13_36_15]
MIDPITDMLNRIRNAKAVLHPTVNIPFSNLKYEIAKILEKQGFIQKVDKRGRKTKKTIEITLKYDNGVSAIFGLKRISRPGQRIYTKAKELKPVKGGYGIAIISTPDGLMTNKEARKKGLGGEILCEIW